MKIKKGRIKMFATAVVSGMMAMAVVLFGGTIRANAAAVSALQTSAWPKLNKTDAELTQDFLLTLTVSPKEKGVKWSSSNSRVAIVKNGKVVGVNIGSATITAKVGSQRLTCKVKVRKNIYKSLKKQITIRKNSSGKVGFIIQKAYYNDDKLVCEGYYTNPTEKRITAVKNQQYNIYADNEMIAYTRVNERINIPPYSYKAGTMYCTIRKFVDLRTKKNMTTNRGGIKIYMY